MNLLEKRRHEQLISEVYNSSFDRRMKTITDDLGTEEREVILYLAGRLLEGQKQYGKLDLLNDRRDFQHERMQERADDVIYDAMDFIRAQLTRVRNHGGRP